MIRRILSIILAVSLLLCILPSIEVFAESEKEYMIANADGFDGFTKIAVSMAAYEGVKSFSVSKLELPVSGLDNSIRLTALQPADGKNSISFASCRVSDKDIENKFVNGSHTDIVVSGKKYLPFEGVDLSDSDGIRVYIAEGTEGDLRVLKGSVKMQFAMTPSKGLSQNPNYVDYDIGFVFESKEVRIGADGFAYVPFEAAAPVDTNTPKDADFCLDYLSLVNAVNIIFTPDAVISDGDYFYIAGLRPYCEKAEYRISATESGNCFGTLRISGLSEKAGKLKLIMDGEDIPPYFLSETRYDSYGINRIDYIIDTTAVSEGVHVFKLYNSNEQVCERVLTFDNTPPYLAASTIQEGKSYSEKGLIELLPADAESGVAECVVTLDGKEIQLPYSYSLSVGNHAIWYRITDNVGNVTRASISFRVSDDVTYGDYNANGETLSLAVNAEDGTEANVFYVGGSLPVEAYANVVETSELIEKAPLGECKLESTSYNRTESKNEKYPYQAFDVDVSGVKESSIKVSCSAATMMGERLVLSGYNEKEKAWEELARQRMEADSLVLSANVPIADFASKGKIKFRVSILSVDNGSNAIAWSSDLQHCIQHNYEDGSYRDYTYYITEQKRWFISEYNAGNIAYAIDTGDISDEPNNAAMFAEAREVIGILDEAKVPNGVVAGNHDANWTNWAAYFGNKYYETQDCFGGAYMDNRCHFDLVTIGGRDFIIMCMGWGTENDSAALKWVKQVLNTYSNRTAILATHGYLGTEGQILYNSAWKFVGIVEECPNVRMVICGHEPGVAHNLRTAADGRMIAEVLQDYQSGTPNYNWWKWGEGGSGLFRYLIFEENTVENRTYTASTDDYYRVFGRRPEDGYYYWNKDTENFTMPIELLENTRRIDVYSFTAYTGNKADGFISAKVNDGKVTVENKDGAKLWCVICNGIESAVYPIEKNCIAVPKIKSAFGVNGLLSVTWESEEDADSFDVFIDGKIAATVDGNMRNCIVSTDYFCGDNITVSIAARSADGNSFASESRSVSFTGAEKRLLGDFDESGEVSVVDAISTLRTSLGIKTETSVSGFFAADIDADGRLTIRDALRILRMSVGITE